MVHAKIRREFIGINQDGETVSGHIYAANEAEFTQYLEDNHVVDHIAGFAGLLPPEQFTLDFDIVKSFFDLLKRKTAILLMHKVNREMLEAVRDDCEDDDGP